MKISKKEVDYVARLARLELSPDEQEQFTGQLESILSYIEQLNRLDTSGVPPTSHALKLANVWREDVARLTPPDMRERLLDNAPERDGDFFKVKKVIE